MVCCCSSWNQKFYIGWQPTSGFIYHYSTTYRSYGTPKTFWIFRLVSIVFYASSNMPLILFLMHSRWFFQYEATISRMPVFLENWLRRCILFSWSATKESGNIWTLLQGNFGAWFTEELCISYAGASISYATYYYLEYVFIILFSLQGWRHL